VILLSASNVFMTFAWYAHLKNLNEKPWWIAALVSWGIALFEYSVHTQVHHKWTNYSFFNQISGLTILYLSIKSHGLMDNSSPLCPFS